MIENSDQDRIAAAASTDYFTAAGLASRDPATVAFGGSLARTPLESSDSIGPSESSKVSADVVLPTETKANRSKGLVEPQSLLFAWAAAVVGTAAFVMAFFWTLSTTLVCFLDLLSLPSSWVGSPLILIVEVGIGVWVGRIITSPLVRFLGTQTPQRMPLQWRRRYRLRSIETYKRNSRVWIALAALMPLICLFAQTLSRHYGTEWMPSGTTLAGKIIPIMMMLGSIAWFTIGMLVWWRGDDQYRTLREREIRRGLRHHRRGVSLRSFIPAFDSTRRNIFRTCRMSRRIANAHQALTWICLGCFSLAGCMAASMRTNFYAAEIGVIISLITLGMLWPTPQRIVSFSATVIDPFCRSDDEYEVYE
ncbi:MAG: hypothetical protein AAF745_10400 [Planctomycetota bacterium]